MAFIAIIILPGQWHKREHFTKMVTMSMIFIKIAEQFWSFLREDEREFSRLGSCSEAPPPPPILKELDVYLG